MRLFIRDRDIDFLLSFVKSVGSREEVAGLLLGETKSGDYFVKEVKILENILHSPIRFEIDPQDLYKAILDAEKRGLEIVGMWHSHPAKPYPSKIDKYYMELWPIVWLIIDAISGEYKAFILQDDKILEVEVIRV